MSFCGILVATGVYLLTEFALRPVAAQALEAGTAATAVRTGHHGPDHDGLGARLRRARSRHRIDWRSSSSDAGNLTETQFAVGVLIVSTATLIFGFLLMWILAWLTATPVRVVRAALRRVEQGDLRGDLVVFDGTELGELQRGFNAMVDGLRERERVRDLFGRHVGREVALAAEREKPKLGGEERHVAVVFIDIVGSTQLVTSRPPAEVVAVLNQFFGIVVEEVDRHCGLVNKFEGDATLAIFGAPESSGLVPKTRRWPPRAVSPSG